MKKQREKKKAMKKKEKFEKKTVGSVFDLLQKNASNNSQNSNNRIRFRMRYGGRVDVVTQSYGTMLGAAVAYARLAAELSEAGAGF